MIVKTTLVTIAKDVDVEAGKLLSFLAAAKTKSPAAIAAVGTLVGAVAKGLGDVQSLAQNPAQGLSISFDSATVADLKATWPDLQALLADLGIKV